MKIQKLTEMDNMIFNFRWNCASPGRPDVQFGGAPGFLAFVKMSGGSCVQEDFCPALTHVAVVTLLEIKGTGYNHSCLYHHISGLL